MTPDELNAITAQVHEELLDATEVLAKAYKRVLRGAGRHMARKMRGASVSLVAATFVPPDGDEVLPPGLDEQVDRATSDARVDLTKRLTESFGEHGIPVDGRSPLIAPDLLDKVGERASLAVREDLRDGYRSVIQDAAEQGFSIPRTANAIVDKIDGVSEYRATTLARTDLIGLMNGSSHEAATRAFAGREDVTKTWLATEDERTRESHSEADGQEVGLNDFFEVGDDSLMYPGDPSGSDEEVINCRCTLVYGATTGEGDQGVVTADQAEGLPERTADQLAADRMSWRRAGPEPGNDGLYHVYHGTTAERAATIREQGLRPPGDSNLTLTTSPRQAARYARGYEGDPVVVHFAMTPADARVFLRPPEEHDVYGFTANAQGIRSSEKVLPPRFLASSTPPDPLASVRPTADGLNDARASWGQGSGASSDYYKARAANVAQRIADANDGMSVEDFQAKALDKMKSGISKAPIRVRAPLDVADRIIADGRFESQFESGSSKGMFNPRSRAEAENRMFGYLTQGFSDAERPIYGYLGDITNEGGTVNGYGDVAFTLKDGVRARTTFTGSDSLAPEVIPSPVTDPSIYSLYYPTTGEPLKLYEDLREWAQPYWEAQIHGGVTLDDIESITIIANDNPPASWLYERAEKMRVALAESGHAEIAVRVVPKRIYASKAPLLGSADQGASISDDRLSVHAAGDVLPVAAGEEGLNGKFVGDSASETIVDPGLRVTTTTVTTGEQHEALIPSHGDDVHVTKDSADPFMEQLTQAMVGAIPNPGQASATEAFVIRIPEDLLDAVRPMSYPAAMTENESTTAAVTITVEDDATASAERARTHWEGILAIEGSPTSDGRYLIPGEIGERELPLPIAASHEDQRETETVGRIEVIDRTPAAEFEREGWTLPDDLPPQAVVIWGEGTFDGSPQADEAMRQMENGVGISLDLPMERQALIHAETYEEVDPSVALEGADPLSILFGGVPDGYLRGIAGKIGGASLASIAAFEETVIRIVEGHALVASGYPVERGIIRDSVLTDVLLASAQPPLMPPREWFFREEADEPTPITILPSGEFYGHLALWNTCHAGRANGAYSACMYAPHSRTNYSQYHLGAMLCDDGTEVPVGRITIGTGHAPLHLGEAAARRHYDHTGTCVAFGRAKDGVFGIWVSGVVKSDATPEQIRDFRACPPSGDWRIHDGALELQAALAVNTPAFPVMRGQLAMSASADSMEIKTMVLGPVTDEDRAEALRAEFDLQAAEDVDMLVELGVGEFCGIELASFNRVDFRNYTAEERRRLARSGEAMPDGSFPIVNCTDARNAIQSQGRGDAPEARIKAHIRKRVGALGCSGDIFTPYQ